MSSNKNGFFSNLSKDLPASLVVFLVALPLCLGIAVASGADPITGVIAGIIGGIVVGFMSGSSIGVSGPAAGLATIVAASIVEVGFEAFLLAVVIAGVVQILMGFAKFGVVAYYFPNSVVKGMLSGIGILLILKQIPHALGHDDDPIGDLNLFQVDGENTFSEIINTLNDISPGAFLITIISLAVLIFWETKFMKKFSALKIIQGPLVVVILGIFLGLGLSGFWELQSGHTVVLPLMDSVGEFFGQFRGPDFSQWNNYNIYVIAFTIALVASLETLLCVEATDKLDPEKNVTPTNRELLAQGTGNIVSGLIGGLPITQVIVRSSTNIQSGGKTKTSAIVHGFLLLGSVMLIPHVLNLIPMASLAAILLVVGYKLAKPTLIVSMFKKGWTQFLPFAITIVGIVGLDMLKGIGLGLAVAILQILWNNFKTPYHFNPDEYKKGETIKIVLSEEVTFLKKAGIMNTLNQLPDDAGVIIDGSQVQYIHPDVIDIINDFLENAKTRDIEARFEGYHPENDTTTKKAIGELHKSVIKTAKEN